MSTQLSITKFCLEPAKKIFPLLPPSVPTRDTQSVLVSPGVQTSDPGA